MKNLLLTLFNHERYQSVSIITCAVLLLFFYGCEPKCKSIINPNTQSSRSELDAEIEILVSRANSGYASLEQQEQLRQLLFEQTIASATSGTVNPVALMTSIGAILGLGATVDNVRKRKEIKRITTQP